MKTQKKQNLKISKTECHQMFENFKITFYNDVVKNYLSNQIRAIESNLINFDIFFKNSNKNLYNHFLAISRRGWHNANNIEINMLIGYLLIIAINNGFRLTKIKERASEPALFLNF